MMRWLRRGLWVVSGLVIMLVVAGLVYRHQVLPVEKGSLLVTGLQAEGEISITRDAHGIPNIRAASTNAAAFGLGFVHAQDRLWQLETHRRIGSGRLAETFGPGALENDKFLRALGVKRAAARQWQRLDAASRQVVEAYTAGINAFISQHLRARPPEFVILGLDVEPWTPEDTLAWSMMMAWDLGGNWSNELLRMRLALTLRGDDVVTRINQLLPPYPGEQPLLSHDYVALYRDLLGESNLGAQALLHAPESGVEGVGSNNWVVAGSHTESGKPLLANDPHLKLTTPALWYFARIEVDGEQAYQVTGATMPGLPFVVLGQNRRVAWGFTNTGPDVQDLYLEQIKPDDPTRYLTPSGWAEFSRIDEIIKIKGQTPFTLTARMTRHGPVISDADTAATKGLVGGDGKRAGHVLAMRWTALDDDAVAIGAGLALNRTDSVAGFVRAAEGYVAPMQNMVVADVDGNIGFVAAGRVPVRRPDNVLKGHVPAPGWDARYDWVGFVPADQTPREINPARGWIATANQKIHPEQYPHYIGSDWAVPNRQQRIEQLLAARSKHSHASLQAIQADQVSSAAQVLLPFIRSTQPTHRLGAEAMRKLDTFDGTMRAEDGAPMIFAAWARELTRAVFADELGGDEAYLAEVGRRDFRPALEGVLGRKDERWCDDVSTAAKETCAELISRSLDRALAEIEAAQGPDMDQWQWGRAHLARSEHRPFSKVKPLARWFEVRVPTGGDSYTVNVARYHLRGDEPYLNEHAASLRAIYDLSDPLQSRFMHSSGQSGIIFSPHFRDFAPLWAAVEYVPAWSTGDRTLLLRGSDKAH